MHELIKKLEKLSMDEKRKKLIKELLVKLSNEDGIMTLTGKKVKPSIKAGERMPFKATLIGYDREALRNDVIRFKEGVLEEANFAGRPLLSFHKHDKIPIGKIVEDWMENGEKKIIAWTDDEETKLAIETGKLMELSAGFLPDLELNYDEKEKNWFLSVNKVDPAEASVVVFPAYAKAEIEKFWVEEKEKEKVKEELPEKEEKLEKKIETAEEEQKDEDELVKLSKEKEELMKKVHELEREKILSKYSLSEEDRELVKELDKKYNLKTEDFEKVVEKIEEEKPEAKAEGEGRLPESQREEIRSDKEKGIEQAERLAREYLEKKGYKQ